ncbi:MAG: hypothetical protein GX868_05875, partial [Actinobacteria bacterium]|nr:hypothetical protein [Actinomycetota bacterium]
MSHLRFSRQASRSTALVALASFVALSGCGAETPAPNTPFIPGPDGVEVVGQPCAEGTGVTVLVDFDALDDVIEIGCAPGAQANGLAALAAAGFSVGSEAGPGSVCTIDGLPTTGFPDCWYAGYWSYYKSPNYDTAWDYSM